MRFVLIGLCLGYLSCSDGTMEDSGRYRESAAEDKSASEDSEAPKKKRVSLPEETFEEEGDEIALENDASGEDNKSEEVETREEKKAEVEEKEKKDEVKVNDQGEVVFRIKQGTGTGAWNSPEDPIIIRPGSTLRIYNDDSTSHTIHTNSFSNGRLPRHGCEARYQLSNVPSQGVACKFGSNLKPTGEGFLDDGEIHDHFTWRQGTDRGKVYIKVVP